jgi:hypothetical protein
MEIKIGKPGLTEFPVLGKWLPSEEKGLVVLFIAPTVGMVVEGSEKNAKGVYKDNWSPCGNLRQWELYPVSRIEAGI